MILLIVILVIIVAVILYFYFRTQRKKITGYTPYLEGLVALLDNNENLAMKKFKEAVSIDSDLIDAYIKLGDLYRKKGDFSKAIQIHQSLTVRAILKKKIEKEVYYALVRDFLAINRTNKAISFLKEILKIDKNDSMAGTMIIKIYEDMEHYGDCINIYEDRGFKLKDEKRLAFYYASFANNKLKSLTSDDTDGKKNALNLLKKALKISPKSIAALYYLAEYFEQNGEYKKAKEYYLDIINHHSDYIFLIIPKFEKVLFELGSFDEIVSIYEKVFNKNPANFSVGLALASLYEKKNDIESAKDVYRILSEKYPKSLLPRFYLLKLMVEDAVIKDEITELEKSISHHNFKCRNCGYETDKFPFICTRCRAIESYSPVL
jgi:lipopolysaccharide biosynthesis regulator YciM